MTLEERAVLIHKKHNVDVSLWDDGNIAKLPQVVDTIKAFKILRNVALEDAAEVAFDEGESVQEGERIAYAIRKLKDKP